MLHHAPPRPHGRGPFAIELLDPNSRDRVLDIGCFDGQMEFHYLAGRVKEFHGIDVNQDAIKKAQQWSQDVFGRTDMFQVATAEDLPFEDSSFDKVLCLDVFEHVQNEQRVAAEILRVLKPGGTLVLSVPHDFLNFLDCDELTRGARNFVRKYIKKKPLLDHPKHRHYSEENLRKFFPSMNFEVIHRSGTPVFWTLTFLYTASGLPRRLIEKMSEITAPLENWDYKLKLPTGFNIMIKAQKAPTRGAFPAKREVRPEA